MSTIWSVLTRKKVLDSNEIKQTQLGRVLNWFDLTSLGIGSTLGVGIYVLCGSVAKTMAGPSVVLSFFIAAVSCVFTGLCYAEFGSRVPKAGSAYIYTYVCIGEFIAFIIGWNLILEYMIGAASIARGLSSYLNSLTDNSIQTLFDEHTSMNVSFLSPYFDILAFVIPILLSVGLSFGIKQGALVNNIFSVFNLIVVVFVVIAGSIKSDSKNWHLEKPSNSSIDAGEGGFFPFGVEGMLAGAATCFYGFVGFDSIATTGEEVKNPQKAVPLSIIITLIVVFIAYCSTSTVVTLMVPYYEQDSNAPLPFAFEHVGWTWAKWIVAIGGIFGLFSCLFGAMFPLPRILYAMASDGLIFSFLGKVSHRFKTPVVGTLFAGLITGLLAALFELTQLVKMMSIGTLLAYTLVSTSIIVLRFSQPLKVHEDTKLLDHERNTENIISRFFNLNRKPEPTKSSEALVLGAVSIYAILCISLGLCAIYLKKYIYEKDIWALVLISIIVLVIIVILVAIALQPSSKKIEHLSFKVPFVPFLPALGILVNIYLMLLLDSSTWIRFGVWMIIGLPTYYFSVTFHYEETRNMSITSSKLSTHDKVNVNGITNEAFIQDIESNTPVENKKSDELPSLMYIPDIESNNSVKNIKSDELPPLKFIPDVESNNSVIKSDEVQSPEIESTIAQLDEIIEEASKRNSMEILDSFPSSNDIKEPVESSYNIEASSKYNIENELLKNYYYYMNNGSSISNEETLSEPPTPNNNEVVLKNLINDSTDQDTPAPPPPPPPVLPNLDLEDVVINISRPKFTIKEISSVKLRKTRKPAPNIPPIDYDIDNDNNDSLTAVDDHLKKGTPEYLAFREKLSENLQKQSVPNPGFLPNPGAQVNNSVKPMLNVPNENVIEEKINRNSVKETISKLLEKKVNDPIGSQPISLMVERPLITNSDENVAENDTKNKEDITEQNEVKIDKNKNINRPDSVQEKQRSNMNEVLNSIKLRRVD